jgi:tetratricopeptide (TPR) repeat protein
MNKTLSKLKTMIASGDYNCHFERPCPEERIRSAEKCLEIELPASYKEFLKHYNGGFICSDQLEDIIKRENSTETAVWNNCYIFSLEEMIDEYINLSDRTWKLYDWKGIYPIIPFARSHMHELLVFILPLDRQDESPVLEAYHEDPVNFWGQISGSFAEFFDEYVEGLGQVDCIGGDESWVKERPLPEPGWKMEVEATDDPGAVLAKMNECLKFDPDDSWNLLMRGQACLYLEEYDRAIEDLTRSISLDKESAFAHALRGSCYMGKKAFARALRDFSIAVEMEPYDLYYLAERAEAWYMLGDYQRAIDETTRILEIDEDYELARLTRCDAYMAIGEDEKAEADAVIIYNLE